MPARRKKSKGNWQDVPKRKTRSPIKCPSPKRLKNSSTSRNKKTTATAVSSDSDSSVDDGLTSKVNLDILMLLNEKCDIGGLDKKVETSNNISTKPPRRNQSTKP